MDGGGCAPAEETSLYEMPEERSIDIDREADFAYVGFLTSRRGTDDESDTKDES